MSRLKKLARFLINTGKRHLKAELFALVSCAAEVLATRSWLEEQDVRLEKPPTLFTDSSAARMVTGRRGPGKMKHICMRALAVQQWVRDGLISVAKIGTASNRADLLTKPLPFAAAEQHAFAAGLLGYESALSRGAAISR